MDDREKEAALREFLRKHIQFSNDHPKRSKPSYTITVVNNDGDVIYEDFFYKDEKKTGSIYHYSFVAQSAAWRLNELLNPSGQPLLVMKRKKK